MVFHSDKINFDRFLIMKIFPTSLKIFCKKRALAVLPSTNIMVPGHKNAQILKCHNSLASDGMIS